MQKECQACVKSCVNELNQSVSFIHSYGVVMWSENREVGAETRDELIIRGKDIKVGLPKREGQLGSVGDVVSRTPGRTECQQVGEESGVERVKENSQEGKKGGGSDRETRDLEEDQGQR